MKGVEFYTLDACTHLDTNTFADLPYQMYLGGMKGFLKIVTILFLLFTIANPCKTQTLDLHRVELNRVGIALNLPLEYQELPPSELKTMLENAEETLAESDRTEITNFIVNNPNAAYLYRTGNLTEGVFVQRIPRKMPIGEEFLKELIPHAVRSAEKMENISRVTVLTSGVGKFANGAYLHMEMDVTLSLDNSHQSQRQVFATVVGTEFTYHFLFASTSFRQWVASIETISAI